MDQTRDLPPAPPPGDAEDRFEPRRLQTIADMRRTKDDRLVAGVCTGVGRHLGVDPVLVRVLVVVLSFVGLAGVILYAAAWLLVPADGEARSVVGRWFGLDENEERVRTVGLLVAGVLAVLAVVGDGGWGWGGDPAFWGLFWLAVPVAVLYWLFAVLPRRRRGRAAAGTPAPTTTTAVVDPLGTGLPGDPGDPTATTVAPATTPPTTPQQPYSWTLTLLGLSALVVGESAVYLVADPAFPAYVATAIGIIGAVLLLGAFTRGGLPLILVGLALLPVLAISSLVPSSRGGEQLVELTSASQLQDTYRHGAGILELDLRDVDPKTLTGRSVELESGFGETRVLLPPDLDVDVVATVRAGDLRVLGEQLGGLDQRIARSSDGPALTIRVDHSVGLVEVTR